MPSKARVSIWIAHHFRAGGESEPYGSLRGEQRSKRALALGRCLGAVLALQRSAVEPVLSAAAGGWQQAAAEPNRPDGISNRDMEITVHLCVTGGDWLQEEVAPWGAGVQLHQLELADGRLLPAATRDRLVQSEEEAELFLYLEDDLILQDPLCLDKWLWFAEHTQHQAVLMPHRFEVVPGGGRVFVDGALSPPYLQSLDWPSGVAFAAPFQDGCTVHFQPASNPHAGMFAISGVQRLQLRERMPLPLEGFVGPLETAATLTVASHWPVFKPGWPDRQFLLVEHGHAVFVNYLQALPMLPQLAD